MHGVPSLVYDVLWFVFWLGCAASLSDMLRWIWNGADMSRLQCAAAFSWLTWFLFIAAVVLDVMELRAGGASGTTPDAPPVATKPEASKSAAMDKALPMVAAV